MSQLTINGLVGSSDRTWIARKLRTVWSTLVISVTMAGFGCAAPMSTFTIVDFRSGETPVTYQEQFEEAYYDLDPAGNVNIVLRRSEASRESPGTDITQIVHLRSVWRPIPGVTVAERSQINGTVTYCIQCGQLGETFEGAGSLFFRIDSGNDELAGTLDLATLVPTRKLAASGDFLDKAELSGRFVARRSRRHVARIVNDMNRRFGPRLRVN